VKISEKSLSLGPSIAQALALALHELATNATKYGSLSSRSGGVHVAWELSGAELELRWIEFGGPPVDDAATGGFGIRVIKASVESQLGGTVTFDWRPEGLQCIIRVPHYQRPSDLPNSDEVLTQKAAAPASTSIEVGSRRRILLLEDESLIAMMMAQSLRELDFDVVGPFGNVSDAIAAIEREPIDVGILDINLAGETAYPVAHILQALGIPFVFITGYGAEAISTPFPEIQVFQKPIEREIMRNLFVPRSGPLCENEVPRDMSATEMAAASLQRAS
jgi:CheY-like chemotaxis protein